MQILVGEKVSRLSLIEFIHGICFDCGAEFIDLLLHLRGHGRVRHMQRVFHGLGVRGWRRVRTVRRSNIGSG